jgi:hypothetical protein
MVGGLYISETCFEASKSVLILCQNWKKYDYKKDGH